MSLVETQWESLLQRIQGIQEADSFLEMPASMKKLSKQRKLHTSMWVSVLQIYDSRSRNRRQSRCQGHLARGLSYRTWAIHRKTRWRNWLAVTRTEKHSKVLRIYLQLFEELSWSHFLEKIGKRRGLQRAIRALGARKVWQSWLFCAGSPVEDALE